MIYSMLKLGNLKVAIMPVSYGLTALKIHHDTLHEKVDKQHI